MSKRLIAFVMCFVMMATVVCGADIWTPDAADAVYQPEELVVLVTAYSTASHIYCDNSVVYSGMNLYDTDLTADSISNNTLEFQVSISSWLEVTSVDFTSSNSAVADVSVRLGENGTHIFTMKVNGNGSALISMSLNGSYPVGVFSINVSAKEEKPVRNEPDSKVEASYESILNEARKHFPSFNIVDQKDNIVTLDYLKVGESRTYHTALKAPEWDKSFFEYCFYRSGGYYFYVDIDRLTWSVAENLVSRIPSGNGMIVTGVSTGLDTLTVEVPVCVMHYYVPVTDAGYTVHYHDLDHNEDKIEPEIEMWDIGTLTAGVKIEITADQPVVEETPVRIPPYNPFIGIDISKVENPFTDVSPSDWYYESLMYVYAAGILNGVDLDGHVLYYNYFGMDAGKDTDAAHRIDALSTDGGGEWTAAVKRFLSGSRTTASSSGKFPFNADYAENRQNTVGELYNEYIGFGYKIGSYTNNPFIDVSSTSKAYQHILWAADKKIVLGYGDKKFGPLDHITREQFCTILLRHASLAGVRLPSKVAAKSFNDSWKISSWASEAVSACQRAGIIQGYPDGSFKPQGDIKRSEMVEMLRKYGDVLPRQ